VRTNNSVVVPIINIYICREEEVVKEEGDRR